MGVTVGVTRRVTLKDAAQILGISKEAVRKRVSRGTLRSEMGEDGRRYVYLDAGGDGVGDADLAPSSQGATVAPSAIDYRDALIDELRGEVAAWREEARRKDTIILSLSQRIPEAALEAPRETPPDERGATVTASEGAGKGDHRRPRRGDSGPPGGEGSSGSSRGRPTAASRLRLRSRTGLAESYSVSDVLQLRSIHPVGDLQGPAGAGQKLRILLEAQEL